MIPQELRTVLDTPRLRNLPLGEALLKLANTRKHQTKAVPCVFTGLYNPPKWGRVETDKMTVAYRAIYFYNMMAAQRRSLMVPVKAWLDDGEWIKLGKKVAAKRDRAERQSVGRVYNFD